MKAKKILFICKNRGGNWDYNQPYSSTKSSGLANSVKFVVEMLTRLGIDAKMVDVIDNNCIDREVNAYNPTHVVVEALWVVPEKFEVLTRLHPDVKWIVRLHSEIPFIANEGMAFDWIKEYYNYPNVAVATNSERFCFDLEKLYYRPVFYLPNFYPIAKEKMCPLTKLFAKIKSFFGTLYFEKETIDIGCFGAVRPLKNHLIQAVAAIEFANSLGVKLRFHINGSRVEGKGDPVLKNLRKLFEKEDKHELIEHTWLPHAEFKELLKSIDVAMQVSFTETYNIVAADAVSVGVPVVSSSEIFFIDDMYYADPNSTADIISKLEKALMTKHFGTKLNKRKLFNDSKRAKEQWLLQL